MKYPSISKAYHEINHSCVSYKLQTVCGAIGNNNLVSFYASDVHALIFPKDECKCFDSGLKYGLLTVKASDINYLLRMI